jgi:hypothetical protein
MYTPYGSTGPLEKESDVKSTKMIDDTRPIHSVWDVDGRLGATVGLGGVTAITICQEELVCGAYVPWFLVWRDDVINMRLNGSNMAVIRY